MAMPGFVEKVERRSELQEQSQELKRSIDLLRDVLSNVRVRLDPLLIPAEPAKEAPDMAASATADPRSAHGQFLGLCRADVDAIVGDAAEMLRRLAV